MPRKGLGGSDYVMRMESPKFDTWQEEKKTEKRCQQADTMMMPGST
ncbi:hypothetical protein FVEN_g12663 [Fusarium venenatum]|nr:hypothetical protein FVEN_g12663 [Fusarium venenatum]